MLKELTVFFILAVPKPSCIENDKATNYATVIDPVSHIAQVMRVRGKEPANRESIEIAEGKKDEPTISEELKSCYDVYYTTVHSNGNIFIWPAPPAKEEPKK